jgi:hypothetical protein
MVNIDYKIMILEVKYLFLYLKYKVWSVYNIMPLYTDVIM